MNSDELPIHAIIESRLRPVRPRGQLPKYGADSALSSLVKRQITGSSDFGTSDNSSVPLPVHATQSLPSRFFPFWHEGWAQFPMAGQYSEVCTEADWAGGDGWSSGRSRG
jgi:hypothetical protein